MFNIVLIAPEIPQNTGNIGRICVNNDCTLHIVYPIGFSLEEKYVKRAGLDYWKYLNLKLYDNVDEFLSFCEFKDLFIFTTKATKFIWECHIKPDSYLVFGNESSGLPEKFHNKFKENAYKIPMIGKNARSLNLANAISIVVYEGIRQNKTSFLSNYPAKKSFF
ncbi:MAG TPA: tRNA (cytidine(34)-2'-O)-methyltransferase [Victivallales bacterium]|nr:tRNA (cytidine(34)-2'-O)-methyltransferase [Victivallales bacterium]HPO89988.1 tRNA (cytidine(34)-2'-O)-methyltransferase [Victivallales bacterium]HRR06232.1 tRNA (cytidine(34)-2'-O)-methyltransferase [Victivallales bacterium]HRU00935.1 tRNA (cytidine(34)-2'-O)-methyltransferase [Victivallales bacterium]